MTPLDAFWHASTNTPIPEEDGRAALIKQIRAEIASAKYRVVRDGIVATGATPEEAHYHAFYWSKHRESRHVQ